MAIWSILREIYHDAQTRSQRVCRRNEAIQQMFQKGYEKTAIAQMFGLSPRRVGQMLVEIADDTLSQNERRGEITPWTTLPR